MCGPCTYPCTCACKCVDPPLVLVLVHVLVNVWNLHLFSVHQRCSNIGLSKLSEEWNLEPDSCTAEKTCNIKCSTENLYKSYINCEDCTCKPNNDELVCWTTCKVLVIPPASVSTMESYIPGWCGMSSCSCSAASSCCCPLHPAACTWQAWH